MGGFDLADGPAYLGSTWGYAVLPDLARPEFGPTSLVEMAPASDGRQILCLYDLLAPHESIGRGWSSEEALLMADLSGAIVTAEVDAEEWVITPPSLTDSLRVDRTHRVIVIGWGNEFAQYLDWDAGEQFDPPAVRDDEHWDWTGGLSEDQLFETRDLRGSAVAWVAHGLERSVLVRWVREWEGLHAQVRQALEVTDHLAPLVQETHDAVRRIEGALRQPIVSRTKLRVLLGVLGGLLLNILASAVWEVLQPQLSRLFDMI